MGKSKQKYRMTAKDWDDAADLFDQGAALAEMAETETHTSASRRYVVARMNRLALFATGKAMSAVAQNFSTPVPD